MKALLWSGSISPVNKSGTVTVASKSTNAVGFNNASRFTRLGFQCVVTAASLQSGFLYNWDTFSDADMVGTIGDSVNGIGLIRTEPCEVSVDDLKKPTQITFNAEIRSNVTLTADDTWQTLPDITKRQFTLGNVQLQGKHLIFTNLALTPNFIDLVKYSISPIFVLSTIYGVL